jgi:hypothetical protein
MVVASIKLTTESGSIIMSTMLNDTPVKKEWVLTVQDRCDSCNAQALVKVTGVSGELMFCGHHYNSIVNDPVGYEKMMAFMFEIVDEREKFIENRLVGSEN